MLVLLAARVQIHFYQDFESSTKLDVNASDGGVVGSVRKVSSDVEWLFDADSVVEKAMPTFLCFANHSA